MSQDTHHLSTARHCVSSWLRRHATLESDALSTQRIFIHHISRWWFEQQCTGSYTAFPRPRPRILTALSVLQWFHRYHHSLHQNNTSHSMSLRYTWNIYPQNQNYVYLGMHDIRDISHHRTQHQNNASQCLPTRTSAVDAMRTFTHLQAPHTWQMRRNTPSDVKHWMQPTGQFSLSSNQFLNDKVQTGKVC
jgi:hypothetical protein